MDIKQYEREIAALFFHYVNEADLRKVVKFETKHLKILRGLSNKLIDAPLKRCYEQAFEDYNNKHPSAKINFGDIKHSFLNMSGKLVPIYKASVLGKGGYGVVKTADEDGQKIALKIIGVDNGMTLYPDADEMQTVADAVQACLGGSICYTSREIDKDYLDCNIKGKLYIAVPKIDGENLHAYLKSKKLSTLDCYVYSILIMQNVIKLHTLNIIHRDIKPGNFMVGHDSQGKLFIKIIDLDPHGIKRLPTNDAKILSSFTGNYCYQPPEVLKEYTKTHSIKSDAWSVGIIMLGLMGPCNAISNKLDCYFKNYRLEQRELENLIQLASKEHDFTSKACQQYQDIVARLLEEDLAKRATVNDVFDDLIKAMADNFSTEAINANSAAKAILQQHQLLAPVDTSYCATTSEQSAATSGIALGEVLAKITAELSNLLNLNSNNIDLSSKAINKADSSITFQTLSDSASSNPAIPTTSAKVKHSKDLFT